MEILPECEIVGSALYLKADKTLAIGDVHIGLEEALNKQGMLVPRTQFKEMMKRIERLLRKIDAETVVINGDLKHEFGTISDQEWRETLKFLDKLLDKTKKVILIKGNHDTILGPIARKRGVEIKEYHTTREIYFCHGHKIPNDPAFKIAKKVIIGHEHPAVSIRDGTRNELFKCFAKGKWKQKTLVLMPSFNTLTTGTDLLRDMALSPFMKQIKNRKSIEIYIVGDETYYFGRLKNLK